MKRVYEDYLQDMLENAEKVFDFVAGMELDQFFEDEKTSYAVVRALEIIGEAARMVPDDVRATLPNLPWREISGMRNKLTHEYFGINMKVVWRTIHEDLPPLVQELNRILRK
ncbi:MAG: DUF86 domain-containing protein [Anaerolineales bacterium]